MPDNWTCFHFIERTPIPTRPSTTVAPGNMVETPPDGDALPDALTSRGQWLCWRAEENDGKQIRIPVDLASGEFASTAGSDTWSDFSSAREQATSMATDAVGVGFVFTDDGPIVDFYVDDCCFPETGKTREWASDIVNRLDSFTANKMSYAV